MFYLLLSILFSSAIFIIFKLFDKYLINTPQAIVTNYATAFTIGIFSYNDTIQISNIPQKPWFIGAIILSCLFISVFNIMAITAQKNGVTVAAIAGKMSVIIPVMFGVILYHEKLHVLQIVGIILALIAVYLTTAKEKTELQAHQYLFPILLFIGSGIIDTSIKYVQHHFVALTEIPLFSATIFGSAFCLGIGLLLYLKKRIELKNILAGISLGIINYFAIYYLLKALDDKTLVSATLFSINNVSIVLLTTLIGLAFFKEKLIPKNWIGICFAIISIFLIAN